MTRIETAISYGLLVVAIITGIAGGRIERTLHGAATSVSHTFAQTLGIGGAQ